MAPDWLPYMNRKKAEDPSFWRGRFCDGCFEGLPRGDGAKVAVKAVGFTLERLARRVAEIFGMEVGDLWLSGKYARIVPARSVFCYWAVRELGMRETEVARRLKLTQPAVCISVRRGQHIAKEKGLDILEG